MFTAIHRALGLPPQPLTWQMLEQAVDQNVREQPDLDWKSVGYGPGGGDWDELAKDVAAMANSGGGVIVLGVRDDHATAAALRLETPVALTDPEENGYRREIFSRTHPPVQGVSFQRLRGGAESERAVAIHVPASLDAPHLIYHQRFMFAAPFRDGTSTNWMAERQLEAAYRLRFAARTNQERDLQALYDDAASIYEGHIRSVIVAVAKPDQSRPATLGRINRSQFQAVVNDARRRSALLISEETISAFSHADPSDPKPGLRRYTAHSRHEPEDMERSAALLSLHDDGSITLVWAVGGWRGEDQHTVEAFMLERAAADVASLVGAASRMLRMSSGYSIAIGVSDGGFGVTVRAPGWDGTYSDDDAVFYLVRRFQPVRLSVPPQPADDTLLATAQDLGLDCVSQAGIGKLQLIRATSG